VPTQTNFEHYVSQTKPNGDKSNLYVIIPTTLFDGITDELYQIHFESQQFMDKSDRPISDLDAFNSSSSLKEFIVNELKMLLDMSSSNSTRTTYLSWLYRFKVGYMLFDLIDHGLTNLRIRDSSIVKITKSISKFHRLNSLALTGCEITEVDPSIGDLDKLEILSLNRNQIKELPSTIGKLKNLRYLTLGGNPLIGLPKEISELDISEGGSLIWISTENESILGDIERYLPNVTTIFNNNNYEKI
jgi:Leucine-rich repeat (LRR) protein